MSTQVVVAKLPPCDVHAMLGEKHAAEYDAKMPTGPWANVCQEAFDELHCSLGTGYGQRLILKGD